MNQKHYDAFISYRHPWKERLVAIHLQGLLEQMKKPDGKKLYLFRDRSALGAGNNLKEDIKRALENSDYLIVLCSPTFSESPYCMEELTYFRKLHNNSNSRIIPLLISGEPAESFPEELRWEEQTITREDGTTETVRREIEPLGADVRSIFSIIRHLKLHLTEHLRVASNILGIPYEDLHQRAKRRRLWLYSILISIVAVLSTGFIVYSLHMTSQIQQRQQALLANESLRLASESTVQMESGDSNLAMLLALEAFPKDLSDPERPLVAEAEAALRSAVLTRQWEETDLPLQHITKFEFDTYDWHILGFYDEGRKIAVSDYQEVILYDSSNGMELFRCPAPFAEAGFSDDGAYALVWRGHDVGSNYIFEFTLYDTGSKTILNQQPIPSKDDMFHHFYWDSSKKQFYILLSESLFADQIPTLEEELYLIGMDGTLTQRPIDSVDMSQLMELQSIYGFTGGKPDYDDREGILSDRGSKYQEFIEKKWEEEYSDATITEDEALLIFSGQTEDYEDYSVIYDLKKLQDRTRSTMVIPGICHVDIQNKRVYAQTEYALNVYSYGSSEIFTRRILDDHYFDDFSLVSSDGSRCFSLSYMTIDPDSKHLGHYVDKEFLWIWDCNDLSQPLLEVFHDGHHCDPYFVSAELEYIFLQTQEDAFQLWSIYDSCMLEITVDPQLGTLAEQVAVSADGTLLAIGYETGLVQVYSGTDGTLVTEVDCSENQNAEGSNQTIDYLEFEGSKLLITGGWIENHPRGWSWIVDVSGKEETIQIEDSTAPEVVWNTDRCLTSDGLLFCTGSYMENALDAIYDLRTQECIFEETAYYHYDESNGILLYLFAHPGYTGNPILYALGRTQNGSFEQLYTVNPHAGEVKFGNTLYCKNSQYVLLVSPKFAKVYEIKTGEEHCTIYFSLEEDFDYYGYGNNPVLAQDTIYDMRYAASEKLVRYPIDTSEELTVIAFDYLKSDSGIRKLTETEKQRFFIEDLS